MNDVLPAEVTITELPNGVRYRLPRRRWGYVAMLGLGALVGGLVGIAFMSFWLWAVSYQLRADGGFQAGDGMLLIFLVFGGWMLVMTLRVAFQGLSRLIGHSEIELRGGTLRGLECWGWLHWSWRRPVAGLRRFDVRDALQEERPGRVYEEVAAATEYNVITPVWDTDAEGEPLHLARGYPRAWLVPLANDLARRCRLAADDEDARLMRVAAPAVKVTAEPLPNKAGFVEQLEQPADSKVLVEPTDAGMKITLPRTFGIQQAALAVSADRLRVERPRFFRPEVHDWTRRQLANVRVARIIDSEGPDGFQVHIEPYPGEGKRFRMTLHTEAEARWLATTLRRVLQMPDVAEDNATPFLEREEQPAGSRIACEASTNGIRIAVPAVGLSHPDVHKYLWMTLGFTAITVGVGVFLSLVMDAALFAEHGLWLFWGIPILFGIAAIGGVEEVIKRSHRYAVLAVRDDTLQLRQTNLYGTQQREWRRTCIADVRVGHTLEGRVANPRTRRAVLDRSDPTWELQIHLKNGEIVRLLDAYGDMELQWLATVLRRGLRLSEQASSAGSVK